MSLAEVEASGEGYDVAAAAASVGQDDLVTLIYTSGTTGPPKGVQLSHRSIMVAARGTGEIVPLEPGARLISWLPAAHIAERMAHHYLPIVYAGTITCCPNPREIVSYLPQVRPTWFFAVPRIWEKLKAGLEAMQAGLPEEQRAPVQAALGGFDRARSRSSSAASRFPPSSRRRSRRPTSRCSRGCARCSGSTRRSRSTSGAAPTPVEVLEFFHAIGIELGELWGMSETCGYGTCNRPGEVKIGTVGPPDPGVEVKIAEDGELLVSGAFVMRGLPQQSGETAEALDADGWLHTGDIGRDRRGRLRADRRPQEGDHHQRGGQEHVARRTSRRRSSQAAR